MDMNDKYELWRGRMDHVEWVVCVRAGVIILACLLDRPSWITKKDMTMIVASIVSINMIIGVCIY